MKTFQFKSHHVKRGLILSFTYMLVVFAIFYLIYGGIDGMADAANNFGSAKGLGLLVAVLIIGPLVLLLQFISPKIEVQINKDDLLLKQPGKPDKNIPLADIHMIKINHALVNQLQLFDHNSQLIASIHPQNDGEIIYKIADEIAKCGLFAKQKGSKKLFGNKVETQLYTRK